MWSKLPTDLIRKIIEMSEPSIDVRVAFGIPPKRLDEAKSWRLWYLLKSHDGIIYNMETETLHVMQVPGYHVVRTPIKLSYHTAGLTIFNEEEEEHMMEYTCPLGCFCAVPRNDRCVTESRVLIKGARPSRVISGHGETD
jgi:hypothetical protein